MSTLTIEQIRKDPGLLLDAVEHREPVVIASGTTPLARLLPVEESQSLEEEREAWLSLAYPGLARAYGPDEPVYSRQHVAEPNPQYEP